MIGGGGDRELRSLEGTCGGGEAAVARSYISLDRVTRTFSLSDFGLGLGSGDTCTLGGAADSGSELES